MSMTQLIIGTALGFIVAQSGLYGIRHSLGWLQREEVRTRLSALSPSPGHAIVAGFIRYAAPIGATVALITLGVWAVGDYLSAKAARGAALASLDSTATVTPPEGSTEEGTSVFPASGSAANAEPAIAVQPENADPYADPDYRVRRRAHRPGAPSLKETLLQRSEDKARAELLREMQQHARRSQYDCEAAEHAARYLKAGLDVWGFGPWQLKYFPTAGYKGATLAACKDIPNVLDPTQFDLQAAVAQDHH